MTVVNPKSISGINSITTGSGSDNLLTIHTNDGTERVRVDSTGTTKIVTGIVTTLTATTGIVTTLTTNTAKVGTGITLSPDGDIFATGVTTSTTVQVGSATTIHTTGIDLGNGNLTGHNLHSTGITTSSSVIVGGGVTISESGIEASGIGITVANINGTQIGGRRNIIINGAMEVAQRGISSTSDGHHSVDRFEMNYGGENEAPTQEQATLTSAAGPYREGHRKAFKITNGNQTGGAGTGDYLFMRTRLEAQDIATSGWDYAKPESFITLSFWVKSSVAQTFPIRLKAEDGTAQNYSFQYTISSANTWQKVVHTFPGNSNLQFDNNTDVGLNIFWDIFRGTDQTDSSFTNNAWAAFSSSSRTKDQTSTWWTTNDATFFVTGVQLEVGPQATRFEHRTYGDELSLCQRYFQKHGYGAYIGFNFIGRKTGSNTCVGVIHGYPPMRAAATGTFDGAFKLYRTTDGDTHASTSVSCSVINDDRFNAVKFTAECTGSFSTGNMATVYTSSSGGSYTLDAEL